MLVDIDLQCPVLSGVFVILCKCIEYVGDLAVVLPMLFFSCVAVLHNLTCTGGQKQ